MEFTELSAEQITQLRGNTRKVGEYKQAVADFADSDLQGADLTTAFPGRKASSVAQALKKVVKRDYEGVIEVLHVTQNGNETVALIKV